MNWFKKLAQFAESIPISIQEENGSIEGIIHYNMEFVNNWLQSVGANIDTSNLIPPIAIAKNMYVEEEFRNQGLGTDLVNSFIGEASDMGARCILLEADVGEDNTFDLTKWYSSFGFETIGTGTYPIMKMILW